MRALDPLCTKSWPGMVHLCVEPCVNFPSLCELLYALRSIPCGTMGACTKAVDFTGVGSACSTSTSVTTLSQTLQALNSPLTPLALSSLTATYYCIPTVCRNSPRALDAYGNWLQCGISPDCQCLLSEPDTEPNALPILWCRLADAHGLAYVCRLRSRCFRCYLS